MSAILDSALDAERLAECRRHDAAMATDHWPTTRTYPRSLREAFPHEYQSGPVLLPRCTADACQQGKRACPCPEACHVAPAEPSPTAPAVRRWLAIVLVAAYAAALTVPLFV